MAASEHSTPRGDRHSIICSAAVSAANFRIFISSTFTFLSFRSLINLSFGHSLHQFFFFTFQSRHRPSTLASSLRSFHLKRFIFITLIVGTCESLLNRTTRNRPSEPLFHSKSSAGQSISSQARDSSSLLGQFVHLDSLPYASDTRLVEVKVILTKSEVDASSILYKETQTRTQCPCFDYL